VSLTHRRLNGRILCAGGVHNSDGLQTAAAVSFYLLLKTIVRMDPCECKD